MVKVRTMAVAAMINFVRELIVKDDKHIEDDKKESTVIDPYLDGLLKTTADLLGESLSTTYMQLQEEVLTLLSCIAELIEGKFGQYYEQFMPGLQQILS